jgi:hypothetical protein
VTPAEKVLQDLGVTEPKEIDVEAIAHHLGALVRYRPLDGCEARIVGSDNAAIITVNLRSSHRRRRYSIAHELGHWCHHRGKALVCRAEEFAGRGTLSPERIADAYAADLLMPRYLFDPAARQHPKLYFKVVNTLADEFETSLTATAIRLIEGDHSPALAICHTSGGRKWFVRAPSVPSRWFPRESLDSESFAFDVLYGKAEANATPRKIGADAWFDRREAEKYHVLEQTIRTGTDEILTLVLIADGSMCEEQQERY